MYQTEKIKEILLRIVKEKKEMITNPATLEAYLMDLVPDLKKETYIVITSVKVCGVIETLLNPKNDYIQSCSSIDSFKKELCENYAFSNEAAEWVIDLWKDIHHSLTDAENTSSHESKEQVPGTQNYENLEQSYSELKSKFTILQSEYDALNAQTEKQRLSKSSNSCTKEDVSASKSLIELPANSSNYLKKKNVKIHDYDRVIEIITGIIIIVVIAIAIIINI
jgi:hypothetical protein